MSVIERTRTTASTTVERSRSGLAAASGRARALPDGAIDVTRSAVALARRQGYATVGAGDVVVATLTRQGADLPGRAVRVAEKLTESARSRVGQAGALVSRAQTTVGRAVDELTGRSAQLAASVRPGRTKDAYAKLSVRGEQVTADLRHDPIVSRAIAGADAQVDKAANSVTSAAQKVRSRATAQAKRERAATSSTPVRPTPAKRVPAHRTTADKTAAAEASVSTTPTHRAAAQEAETRAAAAKKAAATRKAKADEAAAKRAAAADKAAATRKKAAAERAEAAEVRHAAAVKAAATRKKNAAEN